MSENTVAVQNSPQRVSLLNKRTEDSIKELQVVFWKPITGQRIPDDVVKVIYPHLYKVHEKELDENIAGEDIQENSPRSSGETDDSDGSFIDDSGVE